MVEHVVGKNDVGGVAGEGEVFCVEVEAERDGNALQHAEGEVAGDVGTAVLLGGLGVDTCATADVDDAFVPLPCVVVEYPFGPVDLGLAVAFVGVDAGGEAIGRGVAGLGEVGFVLSFVGKHGASRGG